MARNRQEPLNEKSEMNWKIAGDGVFRLNNIHPTTESLPPGAWQAFSDFFGVCVKPFEFPTDVVVTDDSPVVQEFLRDSDIFWNNRQWYKDAGLAYKRGYLLHGKPGTGKTVLIRSLALRFIKEGAYVLIGNNDFDSLRTIIEGLHRMNDQARIIVLFDDVDTVLAYNEDEMIDLMDGLSGESNGMIWIATTNYLDKVPDRLKHRPSRFDRVLPIGCTPESTRRRYIESIIHGLTLPDNLTMDTLLRASEKLTFAQVKELILAVSLFGDNLDETIERLVNRNDDEDNSDDDEDT